MKVLHRLVFALALTTANEADKQEIRARQIPDAVACPRCAISLRSIVVLKSVGGVGETYGQPLRVREDQRGRYWIFRENQLPAVHDAAGRFLQTVGRKGRGPGELERAYDVVPFGTDSLLILDAVGHRGVVFTSSFKAVRSLRLPFNLGSPVVTSWPDSILASGEYASPSSVGRPLHLVSVKNSDGARASSFGPSDGGRLPGGGSTVQHLLSTASEGRFWSAWSFGYDLYEWTTTGRQISSLQRRPSWFRHTSTDGAGTPTTPPPPRIFGVARDTGGFLWVFSKTAGKTWKEAWPRLEAGTQEVSARDMNVEQLWDNRVELIDTRRGQVVARLNDLTRKPAYLASILAGPRVALYSSEVDGQEIITIAALSLSGR